MKHSEVSVREKEGIACFGNLLPTKFRAVILFSVAQFTKVFSPAIYFQGAIFFFFFNIINGKLVLFCLSILNASSNCRFVKHRLLYFCISFFKDWAF